MFALWCVSLNWCCEIVLGSLVSKNSIRWICSDPYYAQSAVLTIPELQNITSGTTVCLATCSISHNHWVWHSNARFFFVFFVLIDRFIIILDNFLFYLSNYPPFNLPLTCLWFMKRCHFFILYLTNSISASTLICDSEYMTKATPGPVSILFCCI